MSKKLPLTKHSKKLQAKCWRFINHKHFIQCGPWSSTNEWVGYSVGLQKPGMTCNSSILGRGPTLEAAVVAALKALKGKRNGKNK